MITAILLWSMINNPAFLKAIGEMGKGQGEGFDQWVCLWILLFSFMLDCWMFSFARSKVNVDTVDISGIEGSLDNINSTLDDIKTELEKRKKK